MSISDQIETLESNGQLVLVQPKAMGSAIIRRLYVTEEIHEILEEIQDMGITPERMERLRADLDYFIDGGFIKVKFFKPLKPYRDNVFEIKSVKPRPSLRLLGRFAEKDVFVVLAFGFRKFWFGFESREWKQAKRNCSQIWNGLFHTYQPMSGGNIHDYLSNAASEKFFRK